MITQTLLDNGRQFGETAYQNQTTIHPLALVALVVLSVLTLLLPRKHALIPCMVLACFIPTAQRIAVFGLDFTLLRIMAMVGLCRVLLRGEFHRGRWRPPDTAIVAWAALSSGAYVLLRGQLSSLIYMLGVVTEALCLYFMIRGLVRTWSDLRNFAIATVVICAIVSLAFLNERVTGRNAFSIFGGVPKITHIREGRLRCQGAFSHPILAGCFWAVQAAYMTALWWSRSASGRLLAATGICCVGIIIVACASSTPLGALMAGAAAGMWVVFRHHTRLLRYAVVSTLVVLHMVMKAPVWHLLSRIDLAGGSTGYHRYHLVDAAIRNFSRWALLGTQDTASWGIQLFDLTNQFVYEGVNGGLLRLLMFVILISMCFGRVGLILRHVGRDREKLALAWGLGVALFVHCVCFFGVSYFGQISFAWYFSLAAIVSIAEPFEATRRAMTVAERRRGSRSTLTPDALKR